MFDFLWRGLIVFQKEWAVSAEFLKPIDLRVNRAEVQANELVQLVQQWAADSPLTGVGALLPDRLGFEIHLKALAKAAVDQFGLPAGECLHNVRSALDNLTYALARLKCDPPPKPRYIQFPISVTAADFAQNTKGLLPQLPDAAATALRDIQPFQRSGRTQDGVCEGMPQDDPLLLLHRINISDKHRAPVAATLATSAMNFAGGVEFASEEAAGQNVQPNIEVILPLREGEVFFRWRTKNPIVKVNQTFDVRANVSLVAGEDLVELGPTLVRLTGQVRLILEYFRPFF
jgi:hypothetical protein